MKRLLVILLIALFCFGLLAGCGPKKEEPKEGVTTEQPTTEQVAPDTTQPPAADTTQPSGK
ncbi:MAG TPA: hypothetical protein VGB16_01330 [candidate division Zixibacteria bacterium]|nr:hypothetical protein [candidate division Zixibacteria bacterium]